MASRNVSDVEALSDEKEPFDPGRHDRSGFSCGTDRLDNFLRLSARKQQKDDFTRVFAVAHGSPRVLGYYALNAHAVATDDLGADRPRRAPNTGTVPALYLSMIAVDRSWQGKGLGSDLAIDALSRALNVSGEVGLKLEVLDVIADGGDEPSRAAWNSTAALDSGAFRIGRSGCSSPSARYGLCSAMDSREGRPPHHVSRHVRA